MIFKVDFNKAYDSVSWKLLEYIRLIFSFNDKLINCIKTCVFTGNLPIFVNECPIDQVEIQKGLKKRNHLTLFLFLLVVEGLWALMYEQQHSFNWRGLP